MTLVFLQVIRKEALVTKHHIVNEWYSGNPVAMLQFAIALNVILTAGEVPHKITPIHEVALVGKEEPDVLKHCRHLHVDYLSATVILPYGAFHSAHPCLVGAGMVVTVHTWEEDILRILIGVFCPYHEIAVLFVRRLLLYALVYRATFLHSRHAHIALHIECHL